MFEEAMKSLFAFVKFALIAIPVLVVAIIALAVLLAVKW